MDAKSMASSGKDIPVDIKFGESQYPMACSACQRMDKYGFWVMFGPKAILVCIKCTAESVVKLQSIYPDSKLLEVDAQVDPNELEPAAKAVRSVLPELSESKALEVAKAAIYAI